MKKRRKHYTPEEKVAILRRHLVEGVPISDLCDESGLQPTVFYRWQKKFFAGRRRPRSAPGGLSGGSASRAASFTAGASGTAGSTSITAGFPETFGWRIGRSSDHCVPPEESAGRLSATDVHDAGRRHRGGASGQRMAGAESGGTDAEVEREAVVNRRQRAA
jgi:transposase